jgi:hypothetical protein
MWHAWEMNMYKVLVGKPEGKSLPRRLGRRWEDGIRVDVRKICWWCVVDSVGSR